MFAYDQDIFDFVSAAMRNNISHRHTLFNENQ